MYGRIATLRDQLITIANTLAWVSAKKALRGYEPLVPHWFCVEESSAVLTGVVRTVS